MTADVKVEALSLTEEVESKGRSDSRPDGSPIRAVAPPIYDEWNAQQINYLQYANNTYERYNVMTSQMKMQKNYHGNEVSDMESVAGRINPTVYCLRRA